MRPPRPCCATAIRPTAAAWRSTCRRSACGWPWAIIEGMRVGQSLGALLGYRFERHLHDAGILQLRATMYAHPPAVPAGRTADQVDARTTRSPLKPSPHERRRRAQAAPARRGGVAEELPVGHRQPAARSRPARRTAMNAAIDAAVAHIRDVNDAVADLALAEGVHQAVIGNYDRSAGTLEAFAKGEPAAGGRRHPHAAQRHRRSRCAPPFTSTRRRQPTRSRAYRCRPWRMRSRCSTRGSGRRLPAADNVGCRVTWVDRATGAPAPTGVRHPAAPGAAAARPGST